jgi:SAM-dependent methyltransferase
MSGEAKYWDQVSEEWQMVRPQSLWRAHSDAVYTQLFGRWLPREPVQCLLKTDLFDEVHSEGLFLLLASRADNVVGMDLSAMTSQAARVRYKALRGTQADTRSLPFADASFDVVVSNSTLDHFQSMAELIRSLGELYRVLRPAGQLLLSLDNLANPAIALRNAAPTGLLVRLGIIPYYVGATCRPGELRSILTGIGFDVAELGAVMHHPSVVALAVARLLQRHAKPRTQHRYLALLMSLERLSQWPTRFLTGHYVAARAVKRVC